MHAARDVTSPTANHSRINIHTRTLALRVTLNYTGGQQLKLYRLLVYLTTIFMEFALEVNRLKLTHTHTDCTGPGCDVTRVTPSC